MEKKDVNAYMDEIGRQLDECEAIVKRLAGNHREKSNNKNRIQFSQARANEPNIKGKRQQLLKELNEILEQLENNLTQSEKQDHVLQRLQEIEEEAKELGLMDIKRLAVLGIGKRIVNLEISKKQKQFISKQNKKDQIQEEYREHRIRKFDYAKVEQTKISENAFIVKPYLSGKGFNAESNPFKNTYRYALQYAGYHETIREINRIFFGDHKQSENQDRDKKETVLGYIGNASICLCVSIIILVTFFSEMLTPATFKLIYWVEAGFALLSICVNFFMAVLSFRYMPQDKTQLQKIYEDIQKYLKELNQKIINDVGKRHKFEWDCPKDFLYVQLRFHSKIPISALSE